MAMKAAFAAAVASGAAWRCTAQQVGAVTPESHPTLSIEHCTSQAGCMTQAAEVVMDMNWRWLHNKAAYNNCLDKNKWDKELCPDPATCASNCALEGVDDAGYTDSYSTATGADPSSIKLGYPKAPRLYLLESDSVYKMFRLKNREFSFDIDLSTLPCGMNAALYFVEMAVNGDSNPGNTGGARYGTGYCDGQCPRSRFIEGRANLEGWKKRTVISPDLEEVEVGPEGELGYCCAEMDILEANREAGTFTAHPCNIDGRKVCKGNEECGNKDDNLTGWCDKDGCGFASYRMGDQKFWGPGPDYELDTRRPFTVVTQFVTSDGTDYGDLVDIKRFYVQDGKPLRNSIAHTVDGKSDSLTDDLCHAASRKFNASGNGFDELGGLRSMGEALGRGMVLTLSIWDDNMGRMLWLDGEKGKKGQDENKPGVQRGPCPFKYGTDEDMKEYAEAHGEIEVTFSKIRYGEIGSTHPTATASGGGLVAGGGISRSEDFSGAVADAVSQPLAWATSFGGGVAACFALFLAAGLALSWRRSDVQQMYGQMMPSRSRQVAWIVDEEEPVE